MLFFIRVKEEVPGQYWVTVKNFDGSKSITLPPMKSLEQAENAAARLCVRIQKSGKH